MWRQKKRDKSQENDLPTKPLSAYESLRMKDTQNSFFIKINNKTTKNAFLGTNKLTKLSLTKFSVCVIFWWYLCNDIEYQGKSTLNVKKDMHISLNCLRTTRKTNLFFYYTRLSWTWLNEFMLICFLFFRLCLCYYSEALQLALNIP